MNVLRVPFRTSAQPGGPAAPIARSRWPRKAASLAVAGLLAVGTAGSFGTVVAQAHTGNTVSPSGATGHGSVAPAMKEPGECNRDSNGDVNSNNHTGAKGRGGGGDDQKSKTCTKTEEKNKGTEEKEAGTVAVVLNCAAGVTGSGTFKITMTPPSGSTQSAATATVQITCGSSESLSAMEALESLLKVGSTVTITETTPPTNGVLATAVTATLTAENQTIVINNAAQTVGTVTITLTGGTGVSGSGTFEITVTPPSSSGLSAATVTVTISAGSSLNLSQIAGLRRLLMVGSTVTITETVAPPNAILTAPVTFTLTTGNLLITISASGTTSSSTTGGTSTNGGTSTSGSGTTTTATSASSGVGGVTVTNSGGGSAATVRGLPQTGRAVLPFVLPLLAGLLLVFSGLLVMDLRKTS